jgi:hypothetical protein
VTVTVAGAALATELTATTDDRGRYEFRVPPGRYVIEVALAGFESWRAEVDVGADTATLD